MLRHRGLSFLDELTEGIMLHTRSTLPHETVDWYKDCVVNSQEPSCKVGIPCFEDGASTSLVHPFVDQNVLLNDTGQYSCNCWHNAQIEKFVPGLEKALQELSSIS
jgi:hypothetical protein